MTALMGTIDRTNEIGHRYIDDENSNDNNDSDDDHNSNDDADPNNNYSDDDDSYNHDEDDIGTECLSTIICKTLRRCSRCTEAIRNGASIDLTASGGAIA